MLSNYFDISTTAKLSLLKREGYYRFVRQQEQEWKVN
jgi:hypothetical protein